MNHEDFAKRLAATLDQGARELDPMLATRLSALRRQAVNARHGHHHVGHGVVAWTHDHPWIAMALAVCLLLTGWLGYQPQSGDNGEVDILLLTDDLPPQAYAERDFNKWLYSSVR